MSLLELSNYTHYENIYSLDTQTSVAEIRIHIMTINFSHLS
jgi:hypothetical protein